MILPRQCLSSKRVRDSVADVGQLYDVTKHERFHGHGLGAAKINFRQSIFITKSANVTRLLSSSFTNVGFTNVRFRHHNQRFGEPCLARVLRKTQQFYSLANRQWCWRNLAIWVARVLIETQQITVSPNWRW